MKCPNCGNESEDKTAECPKCGIIFAKFDEMKRKKAAGSTAPKPPEKKKFGMTAILVATGVLFAGFIVVAVMLQPKPEKEAPPPMNPLAPTEKIAQIAEGEKVDIEKFLVTGKVTVFDFYAEWCGPCMALAPKLEEYVQKDDDVVLRKVNIVNWESPVVAQYGIHSVPNVRVYGKNGKMVGSPSFKLDEIISNIEKGK